MRREINYYPPEKRRYFEDNLQCTYCGNTTAFFIDIRFRHLVNSPGSGELTIELDTKVAQRVKNGIERNVMNLVDKVMNGEKQVIKCANCEDGMVDNQERLITYCWELGCPGCDCCGNYITENDLREYCTECITGKIGEITEDECSYNCMHYDYGLEQVRVHYGITLENLKRDAGY